MKLSDEVSCSFKSEVLSNDAEGLCELSNGCEVPVGLTAWLDIVKTLSAKLHAPEGHRAFADLPRASSAAHISLHVWCSLS